MGVSWLVSLLVVWLQVCSTGLPRALGATSRRRAIESAPQISMRLSSYLDERQLDVHLHDYVTRCARVRPKLMAYGKSKNGRQIWALVISSDAAARKPAFKYVAGLHGDEPSGRQLLLYLAEHICSNYQQDAAVTRMVDEMVLVLIPAANPDGFASRMRENSAGVDLNRDFPDPWAYAREGKDLRTPRGNEQPETRALMDLTLRPDLHFLGSASLHEGAVVANYPMDGYPDGSEEVRGAKQASPDDATFMHLATTYARLHSTMAKSTEFAGGITNGAQWYPLYGGMQDWNYLVAGCMEITLELNDDKWPSEKLLPVLWRQNQRALVQYPLMAVLGGLRGRVLDTQGQVVHGTVVSVQGTGRNATPLADTGNFFRPLPAGHHTVLVTAPGFHPSVKQVVVPGDGAGVAVDFVMQRVGAVDPDTARAATTGASLSSSGSQRGVEQQQQALTGSDGGAVSGAVNPMIVPTLQGSSMLGGSSYVWMLVGLAALAQGTAVYRWSRRGSAPPSPFHVQHHLHQGQHHHHHHHQGGATCQGLACGGPGA